MAFVGGMVAPARRLAMAAWGARPLWLRTLLRISAIVGALIAVLLPASLGRFIDGDEGYLLMAARLISEGHVPYRDFFLPQGPLLPFCFGSFFRLVGPSWLGARLLAALIAVAMGFLVYCEAQSATRKQSGGLIAAALFVGSGLTLGWLTIVKGYALSALCVLLAVWMAGILARSDEKAGRIPRYDLLLAAASGLAIGLATSTRLYAVFVMPVIGIYLVARTGWNRRRSRRLVAYGLGCALGLLPLLLSYAVAPEAFVFDTLLYHGISGGQRASLFGDLAHNGPVVLKSLGLAAKPYVGSGQVLALCVFALVAMIVRWLRMRRRAVSATVAIWPVLLGASTLPRFVHPQYLCLVIPFLAIEAGIALAAVASWQLRADGRRWPVGVVLVLVCLGYYGASGWSERDRYLHTGYGVNGVWSPQHAREWRIDTVVAVEKEIDAQGIAVAASWWPGYFVATRTSVLPELANDFGLLAAEVLTPEERQRFHVVSQAQVGNMIRAGLPRLFVEGNWAPASWTALLPRCGYKLQGTVHNVRLWTAGRLLSCE